MTKFYANKHGNKKATEYHDKALTHPKDYVEHTAYTSSAKTQSFKAGLIAKMKGKVDD